MLNSSLVVKLTQDDCSPLSAHASGRRSIKRSNRA